MAVQEFMADGVVKIDSAVAVISGITYPIRAISSVSVVQDHMRSERQKGAIAIVFGAIIVLSGLREPGALVIGGAILVAGFFYYRSIKDRFVLKLVSHSGEKRVLESGDRDYVLRVRDNIVRAISAAA